MALKKSEYNLVNESVSYIIGEIPKMITSIGHIYVKYAKHISRKYRELSQSDERKRIRGIHSLQSLLRLSFDKLLFALDKDAYIDFINEINGVNVNYFPYDMHNQNFDEYILGGTPLSRISCIDFAFLINPHGSVQKLQSDPWYSEGVPLIECNPIIQFEPNCRYMDNTEYGYSHTTTKYLDMASKDEVEIRNGTHFDIEMHIDITSLFDIITRNLMNGFFKTYALDKYFDIELFEKCDENDIVDSIIKDLQGVMTYSTVSTFLATVTKIGDNINTFDIISNDILNSCRGTIFSNFDSEGDNVKTGMGIRHMAVDISTMLDAIAFINDSSISASGEFMILSIMMQYLVQLQYKSYNYLYLPKNNLKHKKLTLIGKLVEPQIYLLSEDNKSVLRTCMLNTPEGVGYSGAFLSSNAAISNGTFALDKRIFDHGKDFLDTYAKFILIKKRMHSVGSLNFGDGTLDRTGKSYNDYKSFLKLTYSQLKQSLSNIYNRIRNVHVGRRDISVNAFNKTDSSEVLKNINKVVFGINTESIVNDMNKAYNNIYDEDYPSRPDYRKRRDTTYLSANQTISDIITCYTSVLRDRECTYASGNEQLTRIIHEHGNGSLIHFWMNLSNEISFNIISTPFPELHKYYGKLALEYAVTSITEMAPTSKLYDINWGRNVSAFLEPHRKLEYKSVEDLRLAFEDMKEQLEKDEDGDESVFGGILFSDFAGIPLAQEMTVKEQELYSQEDMPINPNDPELESFKQLRKEYDSFIARHF